MATKLPIFLQIGYFQGLEGSKRQRPDARHSKLEKQRQWWKSAFFLFKKRGRGVVGRFNDSSLREVQPPPMPLYAAESWKKARMSCRRRAPWSRQRRASEFGEEGVPYLSLRDLNLLEDHRLAAGAPAAEPPPVPIYLVT
ncbi:hypothetical protein AXF42_Ash016753 [Apostasia shenzhenica]|uniref:Uncharacterized protein n=1 Tax=Apostasia shenzhenica TaxID=1088818 RepID=A0A2I0AQ74_9ASPA|nr:hypothetical protein AXF42_Ash016753 [Apostasia shenzhenica]